MNHVDKGDSSPNQVSALHGSDITVFQVSGNNTAIHIRPKTRFPFVPASVIIENNLPRNRPLNEREVLIPYARTFPFQGRERDWLSAMNWIDSAAEISVRTIIGGAGSGKTRFSLELLDFVTQRSLSRWQGGFLTRDDLRRFLREQTVGDWALEGPTLIVVDYAAGMSEDLKSFLQLLNNQKKQLAGPKLRLMLLERYASLETGWLKNLLSNLDSVRGVKALFHPLEPLRLEGIDSVALRHAFLAQALNTMAKLHQLPSIVLPELGQHEYIDDCLNDPIWSVPLYLLMVAVLTPHIGIIEALKLSGPELAWGIAERECDRYGSFVAPQDQDQVPIMRHIAAIATMQGGIDHSLAVGVADEECEKLKRPFRTGAAGLVEAVATVLGAGDTSLPAIIPDIIGEAFVLMVLKQDRPDSAIVRAYDRSSSSVIQTLIRIIQDYSYGVDKVNGLQAIDWLLAVVEQRARFSIEQLSVIANALPLDTVALREVSVNIMEMLLKAIDKESIINVLDNPNCENALAMRASALDMMAQRLEVVGSKELALCAVTEAVAVWEKLCANPSSPYLPRLAFSLDNLGNQLSGVGRLEDALLATNRGLDIYEKLTPELIDTYLPEVAMVRNHFGNRLREVGRHEDSLTQANGVIKVFRKLVLDSGDDYLADLGAALMNHAIRLGELRRFDEAIADAKEALSIYRKLVELRPDAFIAALGFALNTYGEILTDLGRAEDAIHVTEEAVRIQRRLARAHPDSFLPSCAFSLNNLSIQLARVARYNESLDAASETVSIWRQLRISHNEAFEKYLGNALNNQSVRLGELGRHKDAICLSEEAVCIIRGLYIRHPIAFGGDLAMALNNHSIQLSALGRYDEGFVAAEESQDLYLRLSAEVPHLYSLELSASLTNYGNLLLERGRYQEAILASEHAVEVVRNIVMEQECLFHRHRLAVALNNYGNLLNEVHRFEDALHYLQEAVDVYRQFDTIKPLYSVDLAIGLSNSANVLMNLSQYGGALNSIEEALKILKGLEGSSSMELGSIWVTSTCLRAAILVQCGRVDEAKAILEGELVDLQPQFAMSPNSISTLVRDVISDYSQTCDYGCLPIRRDLLVPYASLLEPFETEGNLKEEDLLMSIETVAIELLKNGLAAATGAAASGMGKSAAESAVHQSKSLLDWLKLRIKNVACVTALEKAESNPHLPELWEDLLPMLHAALSDDSCLRDELHMKVGESSNDEYSRQKVHAVGSNINIIQHIGDGATFRISSNSRE